MCEYCGCQSLRAIDELTREHDAALEHIAAARTAARDHDLDAARAACTALAHLLAPHTAVEEEALFPAMAREHPEHVERLLAEHRVVHGQLDLLAAGGPVDDGWAARLHETMHVLREHIAKEQDGLFPAALTSLGGTDWDAVEAVRARVGSTLQPAR